MRQQVYFRQHFRRGNTPSIQTDALQSGLSRHGGRVRSVLPGVLFAGVQERPRKLPAADAAARLGDGVFTHVGELLAELIRKRDGFKKERAALWAPPFLLRFCN